MDVRNCEEMGKQTEPEFECHHDAFRPKSFLHDEMNEFNKIFAELAKPKRLTALKSCESFEEATPTDEGASHADFNVDREAKLSDSRSCCSCGSVEYEHSSSYLQTTERMTTTSSLDKCLLTRFNHDVNHEASNVCVCSFVCMTLCVH
jgi:hypothetical protein